MVGLTLIFAGLTALVAVGAFIATHLRTRGSVELAAQIMRLEAKLVERIAKLETKVDVFWRIVETQMAKVLHRPTHDQVDRLLEKQVAVGLSGEEENQLIQALREVVEDKDQAPGIRAAAVIWLAAKQARQSFE